MRKHQAMLDVKLSASSSARFMSVFFAVYACASSLLPYDFEKTGSFLRSKIVWEVAPSTLLFRGIRKYWASPVSWPIFAVFCWLTYLESYLKAEQPDVDPWSILKMTGFLVFSLSNLRISCALWKFHPLKNRSNSKKWRKVRKRAKSLELELELWPWTLPDETKFSAN